jgi:putative hemin transport protein
MTDTTLSLRDRWAAHRAAHPDQRIRTAAAEMGVSEAELVAVSDGTRRLHLDDLEALLHSFETLGEVMALTRNDACVHEKTGVYRNVEVASAHPMATVLDEQIDLRLFLNAWHLAFAVETPFAGATDGLRRSLQFFDRDGTAVHKVFLTRKSDLAAYEQIVGGRLHPQPEAELSVSAKAPRPAQRPDAEIDAPAFLADWNALQDTHDFFPLLRRYDVRREQALRLAEGRFADRLDLSAARGVLDRAADTELPIMVFVGNAGCIQIHTGPVRTLRAHGPWYNVLDPGFNLHLNEEQVASAWAVRKPTEDGDVHSVELFDAEGELILQYFGKRKPGLPELPEWTALVEALPHTSVAA